MGISLGNFKFYAKGGFGNWEMEIKKVEVLRGGKLWGIWR